jgi:hypothetical protein
MPSGRLLDATGVAEVQRNPSFPSANAAKRKDIGAAIRASRGAVREFHEATMRVYCAYGHPYAESTALLLTSLSER